MVATLDGTPGPVIRGVEATGFPALVWRLPRPLLCAASAPLGGGIGLRGWVVNARVDAAFDRRDPADHLGEIAAELGLSGEGVGLLTAVDVRRVATAQEGGVRVDATVGVSDPVWAADPGARVEAAAPAAGTINVVASVPVRLSPAALVNAVATVTEAKVQALVDAGVDGTGTPTDAVCVLCEPDGAGEPYGGPRSTWGAPLARAVHAAVTTGLSKP